jgi:hypothetical protein
VSESDQQRKVAAATETLVALDAQADALRAHLAKLRQDLVDVQKDLGAARVNELRLYHIDDDGIQIGDMLVDQEGLLGGRPTRRPDPADGKDGARDD